MWKWKLEMKVGQRDDDIGDEMKDKGKINCTDVDLDDFNSTQSRCWFTWDGTLSVGLCVWLNFVICSRFFFFLLDRLFTWQISPGLIVQTTACAILSNHRWCQGSTSPMQIRLEGRHWMILPSGGKRTCQVECLSFKENSLQRTWMTEHRPWLDLTGS